jgi:hypothetical protein
MQVSGKLDHADFKDVGAMVRSKMYWPKLLLANAFGILVFIGITWATVAAALGEGHPNWTGLALIWLVITAIFVWAFWSARKSTYKEQEQLNSRLPDWIVFQSDGVKTLGPGGATSFHPWSSFKSWRQGKRVILLETRVDSIFMLPFARLPEDEQESLRHYLHANIAGSGG